MPHALSETVQEIAPPGTEKDLTELLKSAHDEQTPVYPIGGATAMSYGLPPRETGWGISTAQLNRIVDYPAADMTITVGTGIKMSELAACLAENGQQLPLDVPFMESATLGGVLATNHYGHRRLGHGTARDYVIGIRAVDGRGEPFAGGGRVVKNVAGYDFCKLLVGSLGTLGIITEVTLKVVPIPLARSGLLIPTQRREAMDELLNGMVESLTQPVTSSALIGPFWQAMAAEQGWAGADFGYLVLLFEGTQTEVDWSMSQVQTELERHHHFDLHSCRGLLENSLARLEHSMTEFGAQSDSALVAKASLLPSDTMRFAECVRNATPEISILAHAGNGILLLQANDYPEEGVGATMTRSWQPWAQAASGNVCLLHNRDGQEATHRTTWGMPSSPLQLMKRIKSQFDPQNILNRGRFIY